MSTTDIPSHPLKSMPHGMPESLVTRAPAHAAAARGAWGSCEIRLVADRVASLRTGSTHKVYRGWRFAVAMQHGHPRPGTTLFTVPVDPAHLVASQSRYALVQLASQGAMAAADPVAFSWSASAIGTADPFATALEQAHQQLAAAGWTPDAAGSMHYSKTTPTMLTGEAALPAVIGLDGWETDGGTYSTVNVRSAPH